MRAWSRPHSQPEGAGEDGMRVLRGNSTALSFCQHRLNPSTFFGVLSDTVQTKIRRGLQSPSSLLQLGTLFPAGAAEFCLTEVALNPKGDDEGRHRRTMSSI